MFLAEDISIHSEKLDYMCCLTVANCSCRNSVSSTLQLGKVHPTSPVFIQNNDWITKGEKCSFIITSQEKHSWQLILTRPSQAAENTKETTLRRVSHLCSQCLFPGTPDSNESPLKLWKKKFKNQGFLDRIGRRELIFSPVLELGHISPQNLLQNFIKTDRDSIRTQA